MRKSVITNKVIGTHKKFVRYIACFSGTRNLVPFSNKQLSTEVISELICIANKNNRKLGSLNYHYKILKSSIPHNFREKKFLKNN